MDLVAQRSIARPAAAVFDFVADAANNPSWQRGMKRCEWTTPGPIAVGSRYEQVASFMGRAIVSTFEVVEFTPGERIEIATVESTFPIRVERAVQSTGAQSCVVTAGISGGPKVPRIAQGLVRWFAQRSVNSDYDRLVKLLEAR
jgi:hypothetical protein